MEWVGEPYVVGSTPQRQYTLVTSSLLGIQFVWSIQQVFVTLELLNLGLTKSQLSLLWIASPLCGLVIQPIVGTFSDNCTSSHGRRRPFMVWGALFSAAGLLVFAWSQPIGQLINTTPWKVAVCGVLVVDLAINVCQASSRALVVDMFPSSQQKEAMAMASVMSSLGHLLAYGMGRLRLVNLGFSTQLRGVSALYSAFLLILVGVSATAVKEMKLIPTLRASTNSNASIVSVKQPNLLRQFMSAVQNVWENIVNLDAQLKEIFKVQLFAWYGWFTFLFYGSTYAAEIWQNNLTQKPDPEDLAMVGSWAMFVFSAVSTIVAFILNKWEPDMPNTWIVSLLIYAFAMAATPLASTYTMVLILFGLVGVSWAATQWVPFALTSKRIHELPAKPDPLWNDHGNERLVVFNREDSEQQNHENVERGGVILGIHNCALTLPQFVSTFGSYFIYRLMDADPENPHSDGGRAVATTLQVGGFTALLAMAYAYRLKRTIQETE